MELRTRIRNIPCETPGSLDPKERHAYEVGFFSAIEAAAEMVGSEVAPEDPRMVASSDQTLSADCRKQNNKRTDLLDSDGENRALRSFLRLYSPDRSITINEMRAQMDLAGWSLEYCPDFARIGSSEHLTKSGAQIWIRHLFGMEHC